MTMMFRRGLPVASALAGAAALLPGAAVAADCVTDTFTSYQNGFGCSIGDLTYTNFYFAQNNTNALSPNYDVVNVSGNKLDFNFDGSTFITNASFTIDFTVTAGTGLLTGFNYSVAGYGVNYSDTVVGAITSTATVSNGAAPSDINITLPVNTNSYELNTSRSSTFNGVSIVDVSITLSSTGAQGDAQAEFSDVITSFTETAGGGGTDVPEPASLTLLGVGIAGLGSLKARRRARKALVD